MFQYGGEEGKREFLLSHNEKLNTQIERPIAEQEGDLIFMQIDVDCDVIGQSYCKI